MRYSRLSWFARVIKEWWFDYCISHSNPAEANRVFTRPSASLSSRQQHLTALFFLQTHTRSLPSGRLHSHKPRPSAALNPHRAPKWDPRVCLRKITLPNTHCFSLQCFYTKLGYFTPPNTRLKFLHYWFSSAHYWVCLISCFPREDR